VEGDPATRVASVTGVEDAEAQSLVRVEHLRYLKDALRGPGAALLLGPDMPAVDRPALRVADPRLAFALCLEALAPPEPRPAPGVHPTAVVAEDVELAGDVAIAAGAVIGARARIGARTIVHANVSVGDGTSVGEDCVLFPNVRLYPGVEVGHRVRIHAGSVIGADGFGYAWDGTSHHKIPHLGSVRIGDDVEIGANSCIDRATTGATEIGMGTKIDNLAQIAHNVRIGPHCLIVAQVGIAGSAGLGAGVVLGGQSAVRDHVRVGDGAMIAGKSGVWNDLPEGGRYSGNPARRHREEERSIIAWQRAPDLLRRVRELEREVADLRARLEGG
jgi:UDP-3-O-[3-hydroxymyristoyl] glucosamine N-acyltransferase